MKVLTILASGKMLRVNKGLRSKMNNGVCERKCEGMIRMKPLMYGVCAAFCFSFTYLLNRSMGLSSGHWAWTACLRYLFMVPIMLPVIMHRRAIGRLKNIVLQDPWLWVGWSFVAYVVFYIPLSYSSMCSPAWLTAATWQVTLIAGILMSPLFYHVVETPQEPKKVRHKVPLKSLAISGIIVLGVVLVQLQQASRIGWQEMLGALLPTVFAATAYPLGNRKTMELAAGRMNAFERIFVLTVLTLPFWLVMAVVNVLVIGPPSVNQMAKSFGVSLIVSVIGTMFFFKAMEMVSGNMQKLAGVEAAQSMEIVFTLLIGMLFLHEALPSAQALVGIALIIGGIVLYSRLLSQPENQSVVKRTAKGGRIVLEKEQRMKMK